MKKLLLLMVAFSIIMSSAGCSATTARIGISREVSPGVIDNGKLTDFPRFNPGDPGNGWQIDLRGADLSGMDLSDRYGDLIYAMFDTNTVWPENLPEGFEPEKFIELGLDPGLGVRSLHEQGITGKGVSIGIIDTALLTGHSEYKDRLKLYEEIGYGKPAPAADMHGTAVSSIAVGRTGGVAPDADLYFIAVNPAVSNGDFITYDYHAQAIDRFIEINEQLPDNEKIRVISISWGFEQGKDGYENIRGAIERAEQVGIFVISTNLFRNYDDPDYLGYNFWGTHIDALADRNDVNYYSVGSWMKSLIQINDNPAFGWKAYNYSNKVFMPMDSRTYASSTGEDTYKYSPISGMSWLMPYVAGLYALCKQVYPDITPDMYWSYLLETSDLMTVDNLGNDIDIQLANPGRLIEKLQKADGK